MSKRVEDRYGNYLWLPEKGTIHNDIWCTKCRRATDHKVLAVDFKKGDSFKRDGGVVYKVSCVNCKEEWWFGKGYYGSYEVIKRNNPKMPIPVIGGVFKNRYCVNCSTYTNHKILAIEPQLKNIYEIESYMFYVAHSCLKCNSKIVKWDFYT